MKRRDLVAGLAGTTMIHVLPVAAQQPKRLPMVGFVLDPAAVAGMAGPDPADTNTRAFVHGLRDLGWIDGRNVVIERRSAEGDPQRALAIFDELLARGVDVIMLGAARWLHLAALQATRTIPIVAAFTDDPVAAGLIKSLARPGGNLTGVTFATGPELQVKRLQLLQELAPHITRAAFLMTQEIFEQFRGVAPPPGIAVVPVPVETAEQYAEAFATILRERADALMVSGGVHNRNARRIAAFATESRLPSVYPWRAAVEAGGLMSYGSSVPGTYREAARLVDRILKGAQPGDIPAELPTKFEMVINAKAAQTLVLTVPPALLARADEVIE